MPDLSFAIDSAKVVPFAATPMIAFQMRVANAAPAERIHTIALRCQIQIEVTRRSYTPNEKQRLLDLFGTPDRWSQTLRTLLWTHVQSVVPGFDGAGSVVDLNVPCSADFTVAATKYFEALEGERFRSNSSSAERPSTHTTTANCKWRPSPGSGRHASGYRPQPGAR